MGGVSWAMQHGIHIHPDRYPGLSAESTFEEFQIVLHQASQERCAMPCLGAGRTWRETTTTPSSGMPTEDDTSVNASEPHMDIDATVAPTATSDEPTPPTETETDTSVDATTTLMDGTTRMDGTTLMAETTLMAGTTLTDGTTLMAGTTLTDGTTLVDG